MGVANGAPLKADYEDLLGGQQTIAVAVENKGKEEISLQGNVVITNVVDQKDDPLSLEFDLRNKPVRVAAGQIAFLDFELKKPDRQPRVGTYTGFVYVTADEDKSIRYASLSLAVPSERAAANTTYWTALAEWLQSVPRWVSQRVIGRKLDLDWPILVLALLVAGWLLRQAYLRLYAPTHPGPVTIGTITNATGDKNLEMEALEVRMRDWLEDVGLRPSQTKPFDSVITAMGPLLDTVPVSDKATVSLKAAINALRDLVFPSTGHKVASTLRRGGEDCYELVIEISEVLTEGVTKIEVARGSTPEEAADSAASIIYHYVMMEHEAVCNELAPWERFTTPTSIFYYQRGQSFERNWKRLETLERYKQANWEASSNVHQERLAAWRQYKEAAWDEPNNVRIRQGLIATQEGYGYVETLVEYLRVVIQWPELLEMRHRLAVNLSFADRLAAELPRLNTIERQELVDLLTRAIHKGVFGDVTSNIRQWAGQKKPRSSGEADSTTSRSFEDQVLTWQFDKTQTANVENYKDWAPIIEKALKDTGDKATQLQEQAFLLLAVAQRNQLRTVLGTGLIRERINALRPFNWQPGIRRYWRHWLRRRGAIARFGKVVDLAVYCTNSRLLKLSQNVQADRETSIMNWKTKVEAIVKPNTRTDWEVHYTAACFYALAFASLENKSDLREELAQTAVAHLDQVVRDSQFVQRDWLFDKENGDPDLEVLRGEAEYQKWELVVRPQPMIQGVGTEQIVLKPDAANYKDSRFEVKFEVQPVAGGHQAGIVWTVDEWKTTYWTTASWKGNVPKGSAEYEGEQWEASMEVVAKPRTQFWYAIYVDDAHGVRHWAPKNTHPGENYGYPVK